MPKCFVVSLFSDEVKQLLLLWFLFLAVKTVGTVLFSLMFLCTMAFSGASLGIF